MGGIELDPASGDASSPEARPSLRMLPPWVLHNGSETARLLASEACEQPTLPCSPSSSPSRQASLRRQRLAGAAVMLCGLVYGASLLMTRGQRGHAVAASSEAEVGDGAVDLLGVELPPLPWQTEEGQCLMVSGGRNIPGREIVLLDCSASQRFSFPPSGEGLIRWRKHPERCIDVAGGRTTNGNKLQLWDCSTQLASMQWLMPQGDESGPIRMKEYPDKCIIVDENETTPTLVVWECDHGHDAPHGKHPQLLWHMKGAHANAKAEPKIKIEKAKKVACHTAKPGEDCWTEVHWAMTNGIINHPDWYPDLTVNSSKEFFQAAVYKHNATRCPLPCNPEDTAETKEKHHEEKEEEESESVSSKEAAEEKTKSHTEASHTEANHTEASHTEASHTEVETEQESRHRSSNLRHPLVDRDTKEEEECHTAEEGEECHVNVLWAMQTGIFTHPKWYNSLTKDSSFEEFQDVLHRTVTKAKCKKPCKCHTAIAGEDCHDSVVWIFERGLKLHPSWYKGLYPNSTYYDVQKRLHKDENPICDRPCHPRLFRGSPSLFCFSVFRAQGYEPALMRMQLQHRVGIFACDEFAVVADEHVTLGDGPYGPVTSLKMPPATVGISKDGTAANTLVFMQAWAMIKYDFRYKDHDWILKADPDAVLLPDRLRNQLAPLTGNALFIKNCNKWPGPGWPMMFGALEAFSVQALEKYMNYGAQKCKTDLQWQAWGEDLYMGECMNHLGVASGYDAHLVGDNVCLGANCADGLMGAYHPFKSEAEWMKCYHQAQWAAKLKKL